MLRAAVQPNQRDWVEKAPMVEFALNSSISATTGFAPFELNHGYMPEIIRELPDDGRIPPGVRSFAITALRNMAVAHDAIIAARVFQTYHMNKKLSHYSWINSYICLPKTCHYQKAEQVNFYQSFWDHTK